MDLCQSSEANISEHIKHIFEEEELDETATVRNFRTTAADGKCYNTKYYNLNWIISRGYRLKSYISLYEQFPFHRRTDFGTFSREGAAEGNVCKAQNPFISHGFGGIVG